MFNFLKKNQKKNTQVLRDYSYVVGKNRPFANAEAHKRLRANVIFSFPEEQKCRVIGITSAMAHEGKTTTAINLAYDMMKAGKRVLLIDADMRMSNVVRILNINKAPGLSNLLVGVKDGDRYVQNSALIDGLPIISCGSIPPNPSELLSSKRMEVLLESLKERYDYIILDLPPIAAVSDALIVSKLTDGMVVVVRQDYSDKRLLDDAIRQLRFNDANIIGIVLNCAHVENKYYGKYGRYSKYGHKNYQYYQSERGADGASE